MTFDLGKMIDALGLPEEDTAHLREVYEKHSAEIAAKIEGMEPHEILDFLTNELEETLAKVRGALFPDDPGPPK